jgi:peptide-methionine (S)-S-oxide reductase
VTTEKATFGAGCFWGVEAKFMQIQGVTETSVGYMGGSTEAPTYEDVCSDATGHAEVVHLTFDPGVVSYDTLLDVFFNLHDPTQLNRQGPDVGSQYRSVIFTYSPEQERAAAAKIAAVQRSGRFSRPVVTRIDPAGTYWPAEEYHQKYLMKRGRSDCRL